MTTAIWQAGKLYQPGDLVRRASALPASSSVIPNAGFESGDTGWVKTNTTIVSDSRAYAGGWCARFVYAGGANGHVRMATPVAVEPGQTITGWCFIRIVAGTSVSADVNLVWLDAAQAVIATAQGNLITTAGNAYVKSQVTGVAPANAAYCYLQGDASAQSTNAEILFDQFGWDYVPPVSSTLIYKAVQATAGYSGSTEPTWPAVLGQTVVDNQVTWEAVNTSRVVWRAESLMKSGGTEPTWPTTPGAFVSDGTVSWECVSRVIEDAKCPHSKVVAIASGKVFAADKDIVRFSATANPLDWSAEQDAGYLPTGLQQANANDMAVLALYRGNLAAFNASSFQMWQVDPDPQAMALLDQMEGIGSTWQGAAQAVGNDLLFLSQLGVRSVGIAGASTNLQAGDVGMPIDLLVQDAVRAAVGNGSKAVSICYPSAGQYWLTFANYPPLTLSISGDFPNSAEGQAVSGTYVVAGGVKPYGAVTVTAGALPPGVTLSSSGAWSGVLTTPGVYSWTVSVTDAAGVTATLADTTTVVQGVWLAARSEGRLAMAPSLPGHWMNPAATWSARTVELAYGNGVWVALTEGTGTTNCIYTSVDGRVWTSRTVPVSGPFYALAFVNGVFIAAGTDRLITSTDGEAWTARTFSTGGWFPSGIAYGAGRYVVVAKRTAVHSTDLATWTAVALPGLESGRAGVAYGAGKFIAAPGGGYDHWAVSTDGEAWIALSIAGQAATSGAVRAIAFGNGVFMALTQGANTYTSPDGDAWTQRSYSSVSTWTANARNVHYGNGAFVIHGGDGRASMTQDNGQTWAAIAVQGEPGNIDAMVFGARPPSADPYWADLDSLNKFQGADGAPVSADVLAITFASADVVGAPRPVLDTAEKQYGVSSLLFDGASVLRTNPLATLAYGTGDASFEISCKPSITTGDRCVLSTPANANIQGVKIYTSTTAAPGKLTIMDINDQVKLATAVDITSDRFHDIQVARSSGTVYVFVNGVLAGSYAGSGAWDSNRYQLGADHSGSNRHFFAGWVGQVRFTRAARNTSNYTPAEFPLP